MQLTHGKGYVCAVMAGETTKAFIIVHGRGLPVMKLARSAPSLFGGRCFGFAERRVTRLGNVMTVYRVPRSRRN